MSAKSQHNNILLAILGFTTVVIIVGLVGYFLFKEDPEVIQGSIEVSEYRVACKLPGRIVDLKVKEGDHTRHPRDTRDRRPGEGSAGHGQCHDGPERPHLRAHP